MLWSSSMGYRLLRTGLGAVFLFSGMAKALDLGYFSGIVNAFGILPAGLAFPAAVAIVTAEVLLGAGLVLDLRGCLGGILALLLGFMGVAGYAIAMGYDIDCGCFGPSEPEARAFSSLYTALIRDSLMVGVVGYLYAWRYKNGVRPARLFSSQLLSKGV